MATPTEGELTCSKCRDNVFFLDDHQLCHYCIDEEEYLQAIKQQAELAEARLAEGSDLSDNETELLPSTIACLASLPKSKDEAAERLRPLRAERASYDVEMGKYSIFKLKHQLMALRLCKCYQRNEHNHRKDTITCIRCDFAELGLLGDRLEDETWMYALEKGVVSIEVYNKKYLEPIVQAYLEDAKKFQEWLKKKQEVKRQKEREEAKAYEEWQYRTRDTLPQVLPDAKSLADELETRGELEGFEDENEDFLWGYGDPVQEEAESDEDTIVGEEDAKGVQQAKVESKTPTAPQSTKVGYQEQGLQLHQLPPSAQMIEQDQPGAQVEAALLLDVEQAAAKPQGWQWIRKIFGNFPLYVYDMEPDPSSDRGSGRNSANLPAAAHLKRYREEGGRWPDGFMRRRTWCI